MFKKIFVSLIVAAFAVNLSAQDFEDVEFDDLVPPPLSRSYTFSIGPKVGVNYSMAPDPTGMQLGMAGKIGYQGGLALNAHFGRRKAASPGGTGWIGVQLEAYYANRGLKTDVGDLSFTCFEVPLLAQVYVIPSLCIELGPTFSGSFCGTKDPLIFQNATMYVGEIKAYDVMMTVGIGFTSKIGFTASARYNLGTSNLAGNFETKVSTISVSIGWLFKVVK